MLSIIIPVYNKLAVLGNTLRALNNQTVMGVEFEVIVVDDGSTDGTFEWLKEQRFSYACRVFSQTNRGPGTARNLGVRHAQGELLLFLDADIIAAPGLLAVHWSAHQREGNAIVVGRILPWDAARGGAAYRVFARQYDLGEEAHVLTYPFILTSNLSVHARDFFRLGLFDENLMWGEDTEFGHRASGAGMVMLYEPQAIGYHNHVLTLAQMCQKTQQDHERLGQLFKSHPDIVLGLDYLSDKLPVDWKRDPPGLVARKGLRRLFALPPLRDGLRLVTEILERTWPWPRMMNFLVWKVIGSYQLAGLCAGMKRYGWKP